MTILPDPDAPNNHPPARIAKTFAEYFKSWGISLPEDSVQNRQNGVIRKAGWDIHYLFDRDEQGEYLEYYARHHMTNDRHTRIYEDGKVEFLEAMHDFIVFTDESTEEEKNRIHQEHIENNRRITQELKKKGLLQ
jgi:hypothetical protein